MDVSGISLRHAELDEFGRFKKNKNSPLNNCLTLEPNLDQSPRAFTQEIVTTMFDKGVAAIVPVDTNRSPENTTKFDIYTLRVGHIVDWFPRHVRVSLYNEAKGMREEITLEKRYVAIVENPLYGVMNEPNSTLQRLIRKLTLLDAIDEQSGSGKLDLIIQLPYTIKSEARRQQAEQRRSDIELQLKDSQYGIAYTDGTEKITQLNRPAENNLMGQVEFLVNMLYGQLGITEDIMNGTAEEKTMLNYYNRTVEPIIESIIQAMQRSFIGPQGDTMTEKIMYFRDPFKLVPLASIAEIADKFTRNEILTANEIRGFMGIPPADDPKADQLINSNMPQPAELEPEAKVLERNNQNES
jgi:putative sterol carrier protein